LEKICGFLSGVGGKSYLVVRQNRYGTFFLIRRYRVNRDRIPGINGHLSVVVIPAQACGSAINHITVPVKAISVIDQS
jgi:hypothetical protein